MDSRKEPPETPFVSGPAAGAPVSPALTRLVTSAGWLVVLGIISKILGLGVQIITAGYLGVNASLDAFNLALSLPEILFQFMMLGALTQLMIPAMADRERRHGEAGAREFSARILGFVVLVTLVICLVAGIGTGVLVDLMAPGFDGQRRHEAIGLCRLMLINLGFSAFIYYFKSGLHLRRHFILVGVSAVLASAAQMAGVLLWAPRLGVIGLTLATLLLNAVTATFLAMVCRRSAVPILPRWPRMDANFRKLLGQTWIIGAFVHVNVLISATDRYFASLLPAGSISILAYASRFEPVFLGVLAGAATAPVYTDLSEAAARGDRDALQGALARGIKLLTLLAFPTAALLAGLSHPLIVLFFQRGQFTARNSMDVAGVLAVLSTTFACWAVSFLLIQTMNALRRPQVSLLIAAATLVLNFGLDALLYRPLGVIGVAWATTLLAVPMTAAFATITLREAGLGWHPALQRFIGSVLVISALAGLVAWWVSRAVTDWPPVSRLLAGGLSGGAIVAVGFLILKPPELRLLPFMRRNS